MEYIILVMSLAGIVLGADVLVAGSVSVARRYKVSDFFIGAAIIGIGTSMPELTVSFLGALNGNSDVAIGNIVGSNIFNVLGILGLTAIFFPITFCKENLRFDILFCIGISVFVTLLSFKFFTSTENSLGWFDGILLIAAFAAFMWISFYRDKQTKSKDVHQNTDEKPVEAIWISILKITGGLAVLILSCDTFVDVSVLIAKSFGVSDSFISLTLIACGTSLPELAASIAAAIKKNTSMALGNIVGSNIFNIGLILGLCSLVSPLTSTGIGLVDYMVMIAAVMILFLFGRNYKISRGEGVILFLCYVAYSWYLIYHYNNLVISS